jgi:hypothetical protein
MARNIQILFFLQQLMPTESNLMFVTQFCTVRFVEFILCYHNCSVQLEMVRPSALLSAVNDFVAKTKNLGLFLQILA